MARLPVSVTMELDRMPSTLRRVNLSSSEIDMDPDLARTGTETSSGSTGAKPWGRLLSLNPAAYEHIDLVKPEYVLGRDSTCDIKFPSNLRMSSRHCRIFVEHPEGADALFKIEDLSKNGTFVAQKRIGRGRTQVLRHNDEIQFSFGSANALDDKYFVFQSEASSEPLALPASGNGGRNVRDHYDFIKELGSGTFARVMLAVDKSTGQKYAIKVISKKKLSGSPAFLASMEREVRIMMELNHENIVSIVDFYDEPETLYLVLELLHGGELFDRIVAKKHFSEAEARHVFIQMLRGVEYLHSKGIAHRDLKPENVLLVDKNSFEIKITDFGLARIVGENSFMNTVCGTPFYLAPDVLAKKAGYSKAVDLWSLGVILYILLVGFPPFADKPSLPLRDQILQGRYDFPSPWWDSVNRDAIHLIRRLLTVDPNQRITIAECYAHPWITGAPAATAAAASTTSTSTGAKAAVGSLLSTVWNKLSSPVRGGPPAHPASLPTAVDRQSTLLAPVSIALPGAPATVAKPAAAAAPRVVTGAATAKPTPAPWVPDSSAAAASPANAGPSTTAAAPTVSRGRSVKRKADEADAEAAEENEATMLVAPRSSPRRVTRASSAATARAAMATTTAATTAAPTASPNKRARKA